MKTPVKARPVLENTPQRQWESFHCEVVRGRSYGAQWHFHPEHQLTLVLKSYGHRVVGDNITPLASGDMVLVGGNVPHVWHQDEGEPGAKDGVHAIIIRFRDDFLGHDFLHTPEMEPVRALLKRASRGLQVTSKTRQSVADQMEKLSSTHGLARVIGLLRILDELAQSKDLRPVSSPGFRPELSADDQGRMGRVFEHIHENLTEDISRDSVAARASLSPGAFSRFFKTRTGKTLPQYVNELRVGKACSRLAETDDKVADIALDCGFQNLANFNRQFHRLMDASPREYRQQFRRSALG